MDAIEIIIAFALSASFLLLVWTIKGFLLRPVIGGQDSKVTIIITAGEKSKDLEREIMGLRWLRKDGILRADVIIVDNGMADETVELASLLLKNDPSVLICRPNEVANIITRGIGNGAES